MTFQPITSPVDYALLASQRTPGICEVTAADAPRRWDERRGFGLSGARVVYRGAGLSRPILVLRLYSDQDWEDWHAFKPLVLREPSPQAADVRRRERSIEAAREERTELTQAIAVNPTLGSNSRITDRLAAASRRANQPTPLMAIRRPRALDIWHPILEDLGIRSVVVENVLQPRQTADGEWTIEVKLIEYREPIYTLARPEGSQAQPVDRFEALIQQADAENQALRDRLAS